MPEEILDLHAREEAVHGMVATPWNQKNRQAGRRSNREGRRSDLGQPDDFVVTSFRHAGLEKQPPPRFEAQEMAVIERSSS
eukprot:CAMPEP_0206488940 /NCGR_PEP_ID=MMETSP0324_2-20121206/42787_1 /ASSEMBLY_ACC=CAM_ASM_000836 /TAXON_ID=2866 /ORGANISM="Crypthecodinium cohnii, Strain Seligo" /LENGTH=80 /DNA_ID=CAMNT_0053968211 /DNA_START=51 /DNA_END=293 /DNA_ORIENTATION=-